MPEARRSSLGRRLIAGFVLVAVLAGGLVFALAGYTLSQLETRLQSIDMAIGIDRVRTELTLGGSGRPGRFFQGLPGSDAFPADLRALGPGFYKVLRGEQFWHVRVVDDGPQRFILLRDYTAYEHSQQLAWLAGLFSLLGIAVLTFGLAWVTRRRLVRPVERLAQAMASRSSQAPGSTLAPHYPNNEIGALATAFDHTYNRLEQALQREQLFTADVGHELRTPLMAALSSCEVLRDEAPPSTLLDQQLARIEQAVHDAHQRLDTYLMLARSGTAHADFAHGTLHTAAQEQLQQWQAKAGHLGLQLALHVEASDATRYPLALLRTVLANLLRNALQYASGGHHIQLRIGHGWLEVIDDGPGIPAPRHAQLFEPFSRGEQPSQSNLGLGLSLVQRICTHQGWQVSVQSEAGVATCFRVTLAP